MEQCDSLSSFSPFELRMLIRAGDPRIKTTTGLQANVVVLPSLLSKDFEEFCRNNVAPLPLLYVSKPGEMTCKPLAQHADIR
uniref:Uncharacterized protein n=1 Tax=Periophthalmus magnuspinnatus TaxID=409849 RepID=A0A3B3ZZ15_9GOBI